MMLAGRRAQASADEPFAIGGDDVIGTVTPGLLPFGTLYRACPQVSDDGTRFHGVISVKFEVGVVRAGYNSGAMNSP